MGCANRWNHFVTLVAWISVLILGALSTRDLREQALIVGLMIGMLEVLIFTLQQHIQSNTSKSNKLSFSTCIRFWVNAVVASGASIMAFALMAVIYGSYIKDLLLENITFGIFMTSLTILPSHLNTNYSNSRKSLFKEFDDLFYRNPHLFKHMGTTIIGAWLGAFVIPLDWDRPWQAWPFPCCLGALSGFSVANFLYGS